MTPSRATVGVLSIGEMGMGVAKLLIANEYRVVTNLEGRSEDTKVRAEEASIEILSNDVSLVTECDYILSIVPPRDALATATRVSTAFNAQTTPKTTPLYFLDLNAISPQTSRTINDLLASKSPAIKFLDGGIIGGSPKLRPTDEESCSSSKAHWTKPSIPISGPLSDLPATFTHLSQTLSMKHISDEIGIASGLKCCFASTSKGFSALCIQAFTTASEMGVLEHLMEEMGSRMPGLLKFTGGMTAIPPKAYRWVHEMEEIAQTHEEFGNFPKEASIFHPISKLYKAMAEDTVLGEEKTERRKRGLTIEDVAEAMGDGLKAKKRKTD
ncbi:6-phosphogluconate dehydrogenase [Halenospora varia]|nr:6-phosphogluconate dehydrogenase [Halenospora varia]